MGTRIEKHAKYAKRYATRIMSAPGDSMRQGYPASPVHVLLFCWHHADIDCIGQLYRGDRVMVCQGAAVDARLSPIQPLSSHVIERH
jgi:hypothetical protein